ncbi:family 3 encapsulin nanocompartment shell protein [Herbidospora daliensis]|uniref:family 3 encapsulin nanocompartment shell protein n=1 Tax=Herbidospora daliensis TaxID=295585 RepID=UPI0007844B59|nr:family 3 encapsulin nanocompartment shell protein [Herbidospora daliensis]
MRAIALQEAPAAQSPGERFAAEVAAGAREVPFGLHLPAAFPLFASRPRYTVRHLLKTADVADGSVSYVHEPPQGRIEEAGTAYGATPEAAFAPRLARAPLTDLSVEVPLPDGVAGEPALLAAYVDYRVLVRLSVVENESLLHGTADGAITGLLGLPGSRSAESHDDLATTVTRAAGEIEETGGSCDGVVAHPETYWKMVRDDLLVRFQNAGITVSRTRMMPKDTLLMGDFRAACTLLMPGVASIALVPGAVRATSRIGLAVHLPQHLMAVKWHG